MKLAIKLQYLIFISRGDYLPTSAHSNNWKPIQIPEPIKFGLFKENEGLTPQKTKLDKTHRVGLLKTGFLQPCL